jgi:hypothetical protein
MPLDCLAELILGDLIPLQNITANFVGDLSLALQVLLHCTLVLM